ncbi:MAG: helix-turn-helix domain-containing protein [Nannocystaceae bacterium]|nr:helix-turn-helix domain-containing protein [Nannocystaceae bacterium]
MADNEPQTVLIDDAERARVALSPIRRRLLTALRKPGSATTLAAALELPRQRIGYHLRALENAGLIELVEQRKRRGFVERVFIARADTFIVDPSILGPPPEVVVQDRFSADHLVSVAAGIVRDVSRMRQAADEAGQRLLTFTVEADIGFSTPQQLEDFAREVTEAVAQLASNYPSDGPGRRFRLVVGAHPAVAGKKPPRKQ